MKQTIQLIGPVSNKPDKNYNEFHKAELHYKSLGYNVIVPHTIATTLGLHHEINGKQPPTEKEIMAQCIASILTGADKVVMLDGIDVSNGAPCELIICATYGIPIIEAYTDRQLTFGAAFHLTRTGRDKLIDYVINSKEIIVNDYR